MHCVYIKKYLILSFILYISIIISFYVNTVSANSASKFMFKNILGLESDYILVSDYYSVTNKNYDVITITALKNNALILKSVPIMFSQSLYVMDAADFLKNISGFTAIRNGGTNSDIMFRGMSGSKVRILMDSGEMIGACLSHMDPASSYISPDTFDVLNIIKGPQTVLWGPVTSGGILQFQRYRPNFNFSNIQLRSHVTFSSNNGVHRYIDSVLGNKYGYIRLIGNVAYSDDYCDGNGYTVHSAWYKWNMDSVLALYPPYSDMNVEINFGQSNGRANYATKIMDGLCFARENCGFKIEILDIYDVLDKIEFQTWHYNITHLMTDVIDSNSKLSKYNQCCCIKHNLENVNRFLWGVRGIITYQLENIRCYSGIDMQINKHSKNIKCDEYNLIDSGFQDAGLFTEFIFDKLLHQKFIGGVRLEHSIMKINNDSALGRFSTVYPAGFIRYEHNIYPSLLYYIGIGTSRNIPEFWELILIKFNENTKVINNFQLNPEKTIQIDFGTHFRTSKIDGWVSSYAGYIKDFILYKKNTMPKKDTVFDIDNVNVGIFGSEIGLSYQYNNFWYGESNISWSWGMNKDNFCLLPDIPPLAGMLNCKWQWKNYVMGVSWRLVASSQYIKKIFPFFYNFKKMNDQDCFNNIPGFGVISVYISQKISQYYKCSIGINNVFNKTYQEHSNSLDHRRFKNSIDIPIFEPGRTWWLKSEVIF